VQTGSAQLAVNGKRDKLGGGPQRRAKEVGVGEQRDRDLVGRDRQAALGNVKDALRRPPIARGVVEHAVVEPVARYDLALPLVALHRQGQLAREAVAVENERFTGKTNRLLQPEVGELGVEKGLDPLVGRIQVLAQEAALLAVAERRDRAPGAGAPDRRSRSGFDVPSRRSSA